MVLKKTALFLIQKFNFVYYQITNLLLIQLSLNYNLSPSSKCWVFKEIRYTLAMEFINIAKEKFKIQ